MGRSSDRPLTVGVDVAGRHAAPRAGPEWHARRGRRLPLAGYGPVPTAAPLQARWPERPQMPQAGQDPDQRLSAACGECLPGSEPREVWMARRRSTVRFCKGALIWPWPGPSPDLLVWLHGADLPAVRPRVQRRHRCQWCPRRRTRPPSTPASVSWRLLASSYEAGLLDRVHLGAVCHCPVSTPKASHAS